jgi:hypothetical protein
MEYLDIIKYAVSILLAVIAVFFPTFYSRLKAVRKKAEELAEAISQRDAAVADAAAAKAELDLTETMQAEVKAAETAYQTFDAVAKQNGTTCGAMKREHVLAKLQAYALSKGYSFDAEKWGLALDAFVATTKIVNAIKR